jgi:hypothetical protein
VCSFFGLKVKVKVSFDCFCLLHQQVNGEVTHVMPEGWRFVLLTWEAMMKAYAGTEEEWKLDRFCSGDT